MKAIAIVAAYVAFVWAVALSNTGCAIFRSSDSGGVLSHPSGRKNEVYGYLHAAEAKHGVKMDDDWRVSVRFEPGVRYNGRWLRADGVGSAHEIRNMSDRTLEVLLVTAPNGSMNPREGVHEMSHVVQYSRRDLFPADEAGQHEVMKRAGIPPWE